MIIDTVAIGSIKYDPKNARKHSTRNLDVIAGSLKRFGQQKPIVVDQEGIVRAGNGQLAAARTLGWTEIKIVRTTLTGSDLKAYAIADNRTGDAEVGSEWDKDNLNSILAELKLEDATYFDAIGFTVDEFDAMGGTVGQTDPDEIPAPPDEPATQTSDLWILGNHRLLCGNSGSRQDLDRLLNGAPIHLVNTDPPYNVKVEPRSKNAIAAGNSSFPKADARGEDGHRAGRTLGKPTKMRAKDRQIENDSMTDDEFLKVLDGWFGAIARVLEPGRSFYIWGGYVNHASYPGILKRWKLHLSQAIIWVKKHPVINRKDFMGNHEWCFYGWKAEDGKQYCTRHDFVNDYRWAMYGWKEGAGHKFYGPANIPDVWEVKKVNPQAMIHLTEKPVELATRAMEYSSLPGENVLDLFGGSGSTMIAAQKAGRHAYLMELDPAYCDIVACRFQNYTSRPAIRVRDGVQSEPIPMSQIAGH